MIALMQSGVIPMEMKDDALLMCEEEPPVWRVIKRARWTRSVNRMIAWTRFRHGGAR